MEGTNCDCEEVITEYLKCRGFANTLECFKIECRRKKNNPGNTNFVDKFSVARQNATIESFLNAFDDANAPDLFRLWQDVSEGGRFPQVLQKDVNHAVSLQFLCAIHCAIWPFRECVLQHQPNGHHASRACGKAMAIFKRYLEGKGKHLCQEPFFIPYFALPYVPDPMTHPSFSAVFEKNWVSELRQELEIFLASALSSKGRQADAPRLVRMVVRQRELEEANNDLKCRAEGRWTGGGNNDDRNRGSAPAGPPAPLQDKRQVLQRQLSFNRSILAPLDYDKIKAALKRLSRVAWEGSANGDTRRRSTGGTGLGGGGEGGASASLLSSTSSMPACPSVLAAAMDGALLVQGLRMRFTRTEPGKNRRALLYHFVRNDLLGLHRRPPSAAADGGEGGSASKESLLKDMLVGVGTDITGWGTNGDNNDGELEESTGGISNGKSSKHNHHHASPGNVIAEEVARLLNALTIMPKARQYVLGRGRRTAHNPGGDAQDGQQGGGTLRLLVGVLKRERGDTPVRRHVLGTLQKCSLRKDVQSDLINWGVCSWIVKMLYAHLQQESSDAADCSAMLSQYSLEYAIAMLMNLVIRAAGRRAAEAVEPDIVMVLCNLLEVDSPQVRECVNGCLYVLLSQPALKERALANGVDVMLKGLMEHSDEQSRKPLGFALERLLQDGQSEEGDLLSDDEEPNNDDEADEEDEDQDARPDDVPEREDLMRYIETSRAASGEELLCSTYLQRNLQLAAQQLSVETEEVENEWLLMGGRSGGINSVRGMGGKAGSQPRRVKAPSTLSPAPSPVERPRASTPQPGKVVVLNGMPKVYDQTSGSVPADLQSRPRIPRTPPEGSPLLRGNMRAGQKDKGAANSHDGPQRSSNERVRQGGGSCKDQWIGGSESIRAHNLEDFKKRANTGARNKMHAARHTHEGPHDDQVNGQPSPDDGDRDHSNTDDAAVQSGGGDKVAADDDSTGQAGGGSYEKTEDKVGADVAASVQSPRSEQRPQRLGEKEVTSIVERSMDDDEHEERADGQECAITLTAPSGEERGTGVKLMQTLKADIFEEEDAKESGDGDDNYYDEGPATGRSSTSTGSTSSIGSSSSSGSSGSSSSGSSGSSSTSSSRSTDSSVSSSGSGSDESDHHVNVGTAKK